MQHVNHAFSLPCPATPEQVLLGLMKQLLKERDEVFGLPAKPSTIMFQQMVDEGKFQMSPISQVPVGPTPTAVELSNHDENASLSDSAQVLVVANAGQDSETHAVDAHANTARPSVAKALHSLTVDCPVSGVHSMNPSDASGSKSCETASFHPVRKHVPVPSTCLPSSFAGRAESPPVAPLQTPGMLATPGNHNASHRFDDGTKQPAQYTCETQVKMFAPLLDAQESYPLPLQSAPVVDASTTATPPLNALVFRVYGVASADAAGEKCSHINLTCPPVSQDDSVPSIRQICPLAGPVESPFVRNTGNSGTPHCQS